MLLNTVMETEAVVPVIHSTLWPVLCVANAHNEVPEKPETLQSVLTQPQIPVSTDTQAAAVFTK